MTGTEIVARAAHDAEDRRGHLMVWACVGVAFVGLVALATAFFVYRADTGAALRDLGDRADENAAVAQTLAAQVRDLGGDPVVDPPAGEPGRDGADGRDGVDGVDGRNGRDGRDGQPGADGEPGPPGSNGTNGIDGQDGVTPPCMAESAQCRGADGKDGAQGPQGPQGPPGPTCPPGYSAQSRTHDPTPLTPGDDETWWVCVADEGQA